MYYQMVGTDCVQHTSSTLTRSCCSLVFSATENSAINIHTHTQSLLNIPDDAPETVLTDRWVYLVDSGGQPKFTEFTQLLTISLPLTPTHPGKVSKFPYLSDNC